MESLVKKGLIATYVTKPVVFKNISNAIDIGIENYKFNRLQHALDDVDIKCSEELDKALTYCLPR